MKPLFFAAFMVALSSSIANAGAAKLIEPKLRIIADPKAQPSVALTFDACTGQIDDRILNALIDNQIPATIFVTARWLKRNAAAFETIKSHPDLFEIENHGENHIPAVDVPMKVYGLDAAGSADAVSQEITNGAKAIAENGGPAAVWFRGATAKYTASSIKLARSLGYSVAGYSLNGDVGASVSEAQAAKNVSHAKNGDVILAHINQPTHPAGARRCEGNSRLASEGRAVCPPQRLADDGHQRNNSNAGKDRFLTGLFAPALRPLSRENVEGDYTSIGFGCLFKCLRIAVRTSPALLNR